MLQIDNHNHNTATSLEHEIGLEFQVGEGQTGAESLPEDE
jgi:hypothetical protein